MRFLLDIAWRDLRASGRSLWVFCACLTLGVTLVAASGGLYQMINIGMLADTRILMGGDLEVDANEPMPAEVLEWMRDHGEVSTVVELDTMLGTDDSGFLRVEVQSTDELYPLYGELVLEPGPDLATVTAFRDGYWGAAIDPVLADRLNLSIGDNVYIGALNMKVRALLVDQPDRNLSADWRGTPVMIAPAALEASELIQPGSRVEYDYRIRTDIPAETWRSRFYRTFPDGTWEVRTFADRSRRLSENLGQLASGLLIIGFSTLFIGGLGVFNSIQAYLQGKLRTIATLRALGLRNRRLTGVYLLQVGILSGGASLLGTLIGAMLSFIGAAVIASQVPVAATVSALILPLTVSVFFGMLTAYTFALPAIGRALSIDPAALFREIDGAHTQTPRKWWLATIAGGLLIVLLVMIALPDPLYGLGFVAVTGALLVLLDFIVRGIRAIARKLDARGLVSNSFTFHLALANLHRPGSPLRTSLISLGSALTLLVVCTLVVGSLVRTLHQTIPEEAPALVLYDVSSSQHDDVVAAVEATGNVSLEMAPLVRSRISRVNGLPLSEALDLNREQLRDATQDEYKLSYQANNIDGVNLVAGQWWQADYNGPPLIALEDREAGQLDVGVGDRLTFIIEGRELDAQIAAIFSQKGMQTKFWFEGIMSQGALESFINRYVGAAYMDHVAALETQKRIAAVAPNVITVRTALLLRAARELLGKASAGLAVVAGVSLAASLLVLISVMATSRARQVYDATILHSIGAKLAVIRRSLHMEYLLLAVVTSIFAVVLGSAIALPLLHYELKLPANDLLWLAIVTALSVSGISLSLGARYLLRRLKLRPAVLLRSAG